MPMETMMDVVRFPIYDSEQIGVESVSLFQLPIGSPVPGTTYRKTYRDTNMYLASMLESPCRALVTGMKCIFLEPDGQWVPIGDSDYWNSTITFSVSNRTYWQGPVSSAIDPMLLCNAEKWRSLTFAQKLSLSKTFTIPMTGDEIQILPGFSSPKVETSPKIEGVMIECQEAFKVRLDHQSKHPERRFLCVLDARMYRAIM